MSNENDFHSEGDQSFGIWGSPAIACDGCEKPMEHYSETGFCVGCVAEWAAGRQLAERTCPVCGCDDVWHGRYSDALGNTTCTFHVCAECEHQWGHG